MKRMQLPLHLMMLVISFTCKAEVNLTDLIGKKNETNSSEVKNTTNVRPLDLLDIGNVSTSITITTHLEIQDLNTTNPTNMTTMPKMAQNTSTKKALLLTSQQSGKSLSTTTPPNTTPPNTTCICKDDRYKMGIMICAIIIAVLVLICAALIICSVALANKVSSLKTKLTQSKRQARSNGDFLSASSTLWPSGIETWQKKAQSANQTMDEISLGETNNTDENHKLMAAAVGDKSRDNTDDKKPNSDNKTMTIVSTVEV